MTTFLDFTYLKIVHGDQTLFLEPAFSKNVILTSKKFETRLKKVGS